MTGSVEVIVEQSGDVIVDVSPVGSKGDIGIGIKSIVFNEVTGRWTVTLTNDVEYETESVTQALEDAVAATAADAEQTALDRVATGEDAAQTGLDRIATGEDAAQTALDRVATGEDAAQTALDRVATGENAQLSRDWAEKTSEPAGPDTMSSRTAAEIGIYSALSAQEWAEGTEPGGPGTKSAQEHAADAAGSETAAATSAAQAADSAVEAALYDPSVRFKTVPDMLASNRAGKGAGTIWQAGSFLYEEVTSGEHLTTAGEVKLRALPVGDNSFNIRQFGDDTSTATISLAVSVAAGRKLVLPAADYTPLNLDVTGGWLEFSEGAKFIHTLGAEDNGIISRGGTRITGSPHFVVTNTASPASGSTGNIIKMGDYVTDGTKYEGLEIHNPTFECLNTGRFGLALNTMGRSSGIRLVGVTKMIGPFSGGFQAHWGGVFDGADPHASDVTESYHPHNIRIDTLHFEKGGPNDLGGHLGLSLSSAYDVEIDTIVNRGWDRTDWIQPGDVYDLVATDDQKDKIMSDIRIKHTEVIDPLSTSGAYTNVFVSGMSSTIRVAGQTEQQTAADRNSMSVDHGEILFVCQPGFVHNTEALVTMHYAKNSKYKATFDNFNTYNASKTLSFANHNTDCKIELIHKGLAKLHSGFGNIRTKVKITWGKLTASPLSTTHRVLKLGAVRRYATTSGVTAKGATSISVASWVGGNQSTYVKGMRLYINDDHSYVTLSRSQRLNDTATTIDVEPIKFAIPDATQLHLNALDLDGEVSGVIDGAYVPIDLENVAGTEFPLSTLNSEKYDVVLNAGYYRDLLFNGVYDGCGQLDDGSLLVNINITASVVSHRISFKGAKFEQSGDPLVSNNIYARASRNVNTSLSVVDCDLNSTSHALNMLFPDTADAIDAGPPMVSGNRLPAGVSEFDPSQGAVAQFAGVYYVYRNSVPSLGSIWTPGSRWVNPSSAVGSSKGYIRTTAGTWVSEGNL